MAISPLFFLLIFTILASYSISTRCVAMEALTMQFTPSYPLQVPPTSTVYGAIVTNILKVVDCDYVQVENIDHNFPQEGQYFYRTTVPVLTRYHITCMDPSIIITRQAQATVVVETSSIHGHEVVQQQKRSNDNAASVDILLNVAEQLSSGIDPTNENITVREFRYLREINTALFSLNIVNSGLNLTMMCQYLQDPSIQNNLEDNYIYPKQAADITCFASVYGLYLGQSNDQVLASLAALEYAVQMHAYHSGSLAQACSTLSYSAAQMLGIDAEGIQQNVCNGTAGISPSSAPPSASSTGVSATANLTSLTLPFPTGTLGTAWSGEGTGMSWSPVLPTPISGSSLGVPGSGSVTGIWNTTFPTATDSSERTSSSQSTWIVNTGSSIIFGTGGSVFSSATSAAGTVAPWFNVTIASETPAAGTAPVLSSGQAMPSGDFTPGASFYVPPKLIRDRLRRHG